jgi:hypothetical protein
MHHDRRIARRRECRNDRRAVGGACVPQASRQPNAALPRRRQGHELATREESVLRPVLSGHSSYLQWTEPWKKVADERPTATIGPESAGNRPCTDHSSPPRHSPDGQRAHRAPTHRRPPNRIHPRSRRPPHTCRSSRRIRQTPPGASGPLKKPHVPRGSNPSSPTRGNPSRGSQNLGAGGGPPTNETRNSSRTPACTRRVPDRMYSPGRRRPWSGSSRTRCQCVCVCRGV